MTRVAVADDSAFTCRLVASYLEDAGDCEVVGLAHDAASTLDLVRTARPDVLTLDLGMPGTKGLELLRHLTDDTDVKVVVISGVTKRAAAITLRALELGAVDFVMKYTPGAPVRPDALRREILAKVRAAATARRILGARPTPPTPLLRMPSVRRHASVIVIGASTGGPHAVRDLLEQLPSDFHTPTVVVQHLPALFTPVFSAELERHIHMPVRHVQCGDALEGGCVFVAPGAHQLLFRPDGTLKLNAAGNDDIHCPSIDVTMSSAADVYGAAALGVVLTGMGNDGAMGLKRIRERGGHAYVQDPTSCVVASMPTRALEHAGADHIATPSHIGRMLAVRRAS